MSNNDPKSTGLLPDSSSEKSSSGKSSAEKSTTEKKAAEPTGKTKNSHRSKSVKPGNKLAGFALLIALGSICFSGYIAWRALPLEQNQPVLQESMNHLQTQVARQQARLTSIDDATMPVLKNLQDELVVVQDREGRFLSRIDTLTAKIRDLEGSTRNQWHIVEVEYLLRLANQRLLTTYDVYSAVSLMKNAEQILEQMDNYALFSVREALAEDLAVLNATRVIDKEDIWLRLNGVSDLIPKLTLLDENRLVDEIASTQNVSAAAMKTDTTQSGWQQAVYTLLADTWQRFTGLFRITTRRSQPVDVLLTPEQDQLIRQKLSLLLEQSKLALMTGEQTIYQKSLQQAVELVHQYFTLGGETSQGILTELTGLETLVITLEVPDIHRSLEALQEYQYAHPSREWSEESTESEEAIDDAPPETEQKAPLKDDTDEVSQGVVIS